MPAPVVMTFGWYTGLVRRGGRRALSGSLSRGHRMARVVRLRHRVFRRRVVRRTVSVRAQGESAHRRDLHDEQLRYDRR